MRAFFTWWLGQLAGLVPDFVGRAMTRRTSAAILEIDSDKARLLIRSGRGTVCVAEAGSDVPGLQVLARVLAARKSRPRLLTLRLRAVQVLRKQLSFPSSARPDLATLLGFEIDRETPFAREEVYWNHMLRRPPGARAVLDVELVLLPRSFADPIVERTRRAGLTPSALECDAGAGPLLLPLDRVGGAGGFRVPSPVRLAASAAAVMLVLVVAPFVQQGWALARLNARIAALEPQASEALELRQSSDRLAQAAVFLDRQRDPSGDSLSLLAAVTRSLPDDTYLTALHFRDRRLTLSGLSPAAAELVGRLARAPEFHDPLFAAPVTESGNGGMERFTLSVGLAQAGAAP
jgi:general secretion pathway protein L